jgi:hypothetical protein
LGEFERGVVNTEHIAMLRAHFPYLPRGSNWTSVFDCNPFKLKGFGVNSWRAGVTVPADDREEQRKPFDKLVEGCGYPHMSLVEFFSLDAEPVWLRWSIALLSSSISAVAPSPAKLVTGKAPGHSSSMKPTPANFDTAAR